jgi:hypothetical protein
MRTHAAALGFGLLLTGCQSKQAPPASPAPPPPSVTIRATDYAFVAPDTIQSGVTTFHLLNVGPGLHHALFVRLDSAKTVADLLVALKKRTPLPAWATFVGGPNVPDPGKESVATLDLTPGNYAIICILTMPGNTPHYMRGMFRALTVAPPAATASETPKAVMPTAENAIQLSDFIFAIAYPITAGTHTFQVVTAPGTQPHEVLIVQLDSGRTGDDYIKWTQTNLKGPAPGHAIGGTAAAASGIVQVFTMTFEHGNYLLVCFVPDMKTGKEHFMEGHIRTFTVP